MSKLFISCLAASAMLFVSCKDTKKQEENTEREKVTVEHISGTTEVLKNPKNVVVIAYGALDSFDELGIPVKGAPKTNLPSYLDKYAKDESIVDIGGIKEPNLEKVNAADPELIVIGARTAAMVDEFNKIAPAVNLDVDAKDYMTSFKNNQIAIGKMFGKEEQVEKELKDIDARIAKINEAAAKSDKKALIVLTNEGRMSAYGPGSRFGIIHDVFGVKPADNKIEVATHGQSISNEFIKEMNPDYIFVIDRGAAIKRATMTKEAFANALIQQTNAYKNDKIVFLNPEVWYLSGGGLKSIKMMITEVENAIAE
ncbi:MULTISPECIES: siderophore ABC transporter substrate-binding protein [Myroides]|uniref:ABC transporter substrate-binding protein n=1 Tax=Myroides albus TaxID=2562892 RepID=A0A6I3LK35_9FLAO|nr:MULTISPECIES: siderophore ABC transporter substrate-binding protein [Myroides]MTG97590.1 ABC transporter substrate-binding protein [Myroides albus]MVX36599.1 ABC transporter substrate-binding protein [Myroides sp. LoEW2-1]UVD79221.1 siderophore ABC transporter substrate-binding protein [Myroides albus]